MLHGIKELTAPKERPLPAQLLAEGRAALAKLSDELGFGFDDADLDYYTKLFCEQVSLHRKPHTHTRTGTHKSSACQMVCRKRSGLSSG